MGVCAWGSVRMNIAALIPVVRILVVVLGMNLRGWCAGALQELIGWRWVSSRAERGALFIGIRDEEVLVGCWFGSACSLYCKASDWWKTGGTETEQ